MFLGYKPKNHPQQTRARGPGNLELFERPSLTDQTDDRRTPDDVFIPISDRFGGFTLDAAASEGSSKCGQFYTKAQNGLLHSWAGERVWCNPPYSDIGSWVQKAWTEREVAELIVMLLPANRTEQAWWQDYVEPFRDRPGSGLSVEFLRGRLRFIMPGHAGVEPNQRPPFGCCLLIFS